MLCRPLLAGLTALLSVHAAQAQQETSSPEPASKPTRLEVLPEEVLSTEVRQLGEKEVTIQKIAPRQLPALPDAAPAPGKQSSSVQARQLPLQADTRPMQFLFLGATVHLFKDRPDKVRSLVQCQVAGSGRMVSFWTNANLLWLTGGINQLDVGSERYGVHAAVSRMEWNRPDETVIRHGKEVSAPIAPEFADESKASFVVAEGQPTEDDLAPIRALLVVYNRDREQLKAAYEQRCAEAARQAAERAANPTKKKNLVLRYWRLDEAGQAQQAAETSNPGTAQ